MDQSCKSNVERKSLDFVTLIHLSDLHFPFRIDHPQQNLNPDIKCDAFAPELVKLMAAHNADFIVVTGDLADNAMSNIFALGG